MDKKRHFQVLIIGGGTAGITVAAGLKRRNPHARIAIIEPSEVHYYQPLYTLVGAGADKIEKTARPMSSVMPEGVTWIKNRVASFRPDQNLVSTNDEELNYDFLVVAPGLQVDWHLIEGLEATLGQNNVCSVYGYKEASDTWKLLKEFKGGRAIFTAAWTPVKCGGAAQKVMYLFEAYLRKKKLRDKTKVQFISSGTKIFAVEGFTETLEKLIKEKGIETLFYRDLIKVDGPAKKAWFKIHEPGKEEKIVEESFDFLHVVPPQSAPDIIKESDLAIQDGNSKGWMDVDHYTLQHNRFDNVFGLGDVAGIPTAKTGAAIRKQAPVVINRISELLNGTGKEVTTVYDGYSACPILTDYSHVLLAEFGYKNKPMPSFPIDTTKPRFSMYVLKHYLLPWFYWNKMLKGKGLK